MDNIKSCRIISITYMSCFIVSKNDTINIFSMSLASPMCLHVGTSVHITPGEIYGICHI